MLFVSAETEEKITRKNFCLHACSGLCCQDMKFGEMSKEEFAVLSGKSSPKKIGSIYDLYQQAKRYASGKDIPDGLYYVNLGNGSIIANLIGPCPNRTQEGACSVYRKRPPACRNFQVGEDACVMRRKEVGLITPNSIRVKEKNR